MNHNGGCYQCERISLPLGSHWNDVSASGNTLLKINIGISKTLKTLSSEVQAKERKREHIRMVLIVCLKQKDKNRKYYKPKVYNVYIDKDSKCIYR